MGSKTATGLNRAFGLALRFSAYALACLPAQAAAASFEKVIEDQPGVLVLELTVPSFRVSPTGGASGAAGEQVSCTGCRPMGQEGAPDLPIHRFNVVSGPYAPKVTLAVLESETRIVSDGIAPYPRYLGSTRMEYRRDQAAFARAASGEARVFGLQKVRGVPMRSIEVPLALWNEGPHTLSLIKRVRVRIEFPGVLSRPAPALEAALRREVKNPAGGAWLYASASASVPRRPALVAPGGRALGKASAASGKAALPVATSLGDTLLRIKIRNKNAESLVEDRYYAIPFASLSPDMQRLFSGRKLAWMRLLTGINDTLTSAMDTVALPGRLHEIPMQVADADSSGTFNAGDTLMFFAHGTNIWKRNEDGRTAIRYDFSNDPYSFENFYYIDFGTTARTTLRLEPSATPAPVGTPLSASLYYLHAEKDAETAACDPTKAKDLEVGPDWHWKWKGTGCAGESSLDLTAADLASDEASAMSNRVGDTVLIGMFTYPSGGGFDVIFRGKTLERLPDSIIPGTWYDSVKTGSWFLSTEPFPAASAFIPDQVRWSGGTPRFEGYSVIYNRSHVLPAGQSIWIFPPETGKAVSYRVEGGEKAFCARILDGEATALFVLDGNGVFTDSLPAGSNSRYLVFRSPTPFASSAIDLEILPKAEGKGPIRDLATCDNTDLNKLPDYLILTARPLLDKALALRDYRNASTRALHTRASVVLVEDIYRQFSGGRLSPTAIRDFLRYAYQGWGRGSEAAGTLKYVLLFGDGNYDYRKLSPSTRGAAVNHIPPFEYMSLRASNSDVYDQLATDDYYAAFDPGQFNLEGASLSLAIGRLPVQSAEEADGYLAKIRAYEDPRKAGEWRAHMVLAADDNLQRGNPGNLDLIWQGHTTDTDLLGKTIQDNQLGTALDKVYLLDYPLNSAFHKPQAAQDLLTFINRGAVAVNYVGHGASNQWADEVLLQTNDGVARMRNEGRNGMVNAFSCTVGRFESLTSEGMSEQFVKTPRIGAIGAVSATRESYPGPNLVLADDFYDRAFPPDSSSTAISVGEALQYAKNATVQSSGLNNLKYCLLGEPVLLVRKPPLQVSLTQVMDTIRALDCGNLRGKVIGGTGSGKINLKVMAGTVKKVYDNLGPGMTAQKAEKRGNILFEGTVPYKNGEFSAQYFIPKQISFGDTNAQVLAFAWDDSLEREGTTAVAGLSIRGTSTSSCGSDTDGKGPRILISGCEKKETGNVDFPEKVKLSLPYCLQVDVTDSSGGVITAEGPDEGTTFEIPGAVDPYHPQPGIDDLFHKSYQLTLDPQTIRPGNHLLKVSARDGYGNYSARQMQMDITLDSSIVAIQAYNHPNPIKRNGTTFYFATGMPSAELEYGAGAESSEDRLAFQIRIFNQAGRLVQVFENAVSGETQWDGRDRWGNQLANGVYFYKITGTQIRFEVEDRPGYSTVSSKYNTLVLSR